MRWLLGALLCLGASLAHAQSNAINYNNSCAAAVAASCVLRTAGPGLLYRFTVSNWTATALTVYLVDAGTVPTGGGAAIPAASVIGSYGIAVGSATSPSVLDVSFLDRALGMFNGIVLLCSSTGVSGGVPTYTASANCTFTGYTQ